MIGETPQIVPREDYRDPECCGIIMPVSRGDHADLTCNEMWCCCGEGVAVQRCVQ